MSGRKGGGRESGREGGREGEVDIKNNQCMLIKDEHILGE